MRERFATYQELQLEWEQYRDSLRWKRSKGHEYLFRGTDSKGNGRSLGPRSPETESILASYTHRKQQLEERQASLQEWMREQARFVKAARLDRFPRLPARIIRELSRARLQDKALLVVGSHALYAYESEAGILFESALLATQDLDLLWDTRSRLQISSRIETRHLLEILRKADPSFEILGRHSYRAVNKSGFLVDLVKPEPVPPWKADPKTLGPENDLWATPIKNLDWLRDAPKFHAIVLDQDGFPLYLTVPDPRAFCLHKLWVSEQPDRSPQKAPRDRDQAHAVALLTAQKLPQLPMNASLLRHIPWNVAHKLPDLPAGF